jgi:hypothetical protein
MRQHTKEYGVYHWDTFDNETMLLAEFDVKRDALEFIDKEYGKRISPRGADQVDLVDSKGGIVARWKVC